MLGLLRAEEEGGGGGGAPSIECVKAQKRNNPSQTHSLQVHFSHMTGEAPRSPHSKRILQRNSVVQNPKETTLPASLQLQPPSRSQPSDRLSTSRSLLYMGGLLSRRGASVRLASWNVAAVNNNPFEYYTTLADPR